ncbi:S-layer homology domain-containing protein [Myxacorys almedinensis]|uniref:S-layer homology domain-containing protein n=1 Tax=Myxacorys almedinensis A TaxID=2690445 RepID=A0A8J7YYW3_9CYAN|nr:S-layer homology domain-containing protein [Myxacorys almedinensis]NDJ17137.1 S-layer homology domain-containing protein [Myxacorys almedinensis A]
MTSSPDPRRDDPLSPASERRRLTADELIAMVVAFLSIGSIFAWALTQTDQAFDFGTLSRSVLPSTPSQVPATVPPSPTAGLGIPTAPQPFSTVAPVPSTGGGIFAPVSPQVGVQSQIPVVPIVPPSAIAPSPLPTLTPAPSVAPLPLPVPNASLPTGFSDVPADYWAAAYIAELARRNVINGFTNGTFQPNKPVTRAEFAGILSKAFDKPKTQDLLPFRDLESDYWAKSAIDESVQTGFMNGYPGGVFQPNQEIPILQLQSALATGLSLEPPAQPEQILARFEDANEIPKWAQGKVAAAVESGIVTNYPSPQQLDPTRISTRADAAALVYRAMVRDGRIAPNVR